MPRARELRAEEYPPWLASTELPELSVEVLAYETALAAHSKKDRRKAKRVLTQAKTDHTRRILAERERWAALTLTARKIELRRDAERLQAQLEWVERFRADEAAKDRKRRKKDKRHERRRAAELDAKKAEVEAAAPVPDIEPEASNVTPFPGQDPERPRRRRSRFGAYSTSSILFDDDDDE